MNPQLNKLVRGTTVVATLTVSYFFITADYGPEPTAIDPIKNAILSAEDYVKNFFGPTKESQDSKTEKLASNTAEKHP